MVEALYNAYFTDGRDIGNIDVLLDIATENDLDVASLRDYLLSDDDIDNIYDQNARAHRLGINGVPAFAINGGMIISGAQEPEVLVRVLDAAYISELNDADKKTRHCVSALHQLSMTYSAEQDRVLFRLSTTEKTEYQMWLTRRFVHVLWGALKQTFERDAALKSAITEDVKDAILGMEHQEAVQKTDFDTPPTKETTNLTSNTGPLLVTGGSVSPGENITSLKFSTLEGTGHSL